jgi:SAM-dependent methyltransferase
MKKAMWTAFIITALLLFPAIASAQEYEPSVGQAGKDVIWVPTSDDLVTTMLDMAKVTPNDFVMDLGSGDGRIVIAAAKRGARAVGVEYNPDMVELSKHNAEKAGVADKASFVNADLFTVDLSKATVITMYLLSSLNMRLRPAILSLKPGIRVVSHTFTMEDWKPDQSVDLQSGMAYFWIVPAKVDGSWTWPSNPGVAELKLRQSFQMISGTLTARGKDLQLTNAKLEGSNISFTAGNQQYSGTVNGKMIEGSVKTNGQEQKWSATLK